MVNHNALIAIGNFISYSCYESILFSHYYNKKFHFHTSLNAAPQNKEAVRQVSGLQLNQLKPGIGRLANHRPGGAGL